jgi:hypothetical protein
MRSRATQYCIPPENLFPLPLVRENATLTQVRGIAVVPFAQPDSGASRRHNLRQSSLPCARAMDALQQDTAAQRPVLYASARGGEGQTTNLPTALRQCFCSVICRSLLDWRQRRLCSLPPMLLVQSWAPRTDDDWTMSCWSAAVGRKGSSSGPPSRNSRIVFSPCLASPLP